jgi:hypothetical protein
MVKGTDSVWRELAGVPEGSEFQLRAFANFGGRALYDSSTPLAQIFADQR